MTSPREPLSSEEIWDKARAITLQFQAHDYSPIEAVLILAAAIGFVMRRYDGDASGLPEVASEAIRLAAGKEVH